MKRHWMQKKVLKLPTKVSIHDVTKVRVLHPKTSAPAPVLNERLLEAVRQVTQQHLEAFKRLADK